MYQQPYTNPITSVHVEEAIRLVQQMRAFPKCGSPSLLMALQAEGYREHYNRPGHRNHNLREITLPRRWLVEQCERKGETTQFWLRDQIGRKRAIIRIGDVGTPRRATGFFGLLYHNHRLFDCDAAGEILPREDSDRAVRRGVWITKKGQPVHLIGYVNEHHCPVALNMMAEAYLSEHYPDYRNYAAYWS